MSRPDDVVSIAPSRITPRALHGEEEPCSARTVAGEPPRAGGMLPAVALVLAVAIAGVLVRKQFRTVVAEIAPPARAAIFERVQRDLREICQLPEGLLSPLRDHCAEQALFALQFPECDATCAAVARGLLPPASR